MIKYLTFQSAKSLYCCRARNQTECSASKGLRSFMIFAMNRWNVRFRRLGFKCRETRVRARAHGSMRTLARLPQNFSVMLLHKAKRSRLNLKDRVLKSQAQSIILYAVFFYKLKILKLFNNFKSIEYRTKVKNFNNY